MEVFVSILIVFIFLSFNDNPPGSLIVRKCRVNDYLTCCFVRSAQGYPFLVNSEIKSKKDFAENILCKINSFRYSYRSRRVWSLPRSQGGTIVSRFGRWVINVACTDCCVQCMRHEKWFSHFRLVIPGCSFPYCDALKRKIQCLV